VIDADASAAVGFLRKIRMMVILYRFQDSFVGLGRELDKVSEKGQSEGEGRE